MRQGIGTDLLGPDDPRGESIGILYVQPSDDRKSVLAALITQEKLGRKQVVVVLPDLNAAFRRPIDFEDLKGLRRRLKTEIVFIAPKGVGPAEFARQRGFPVYSTLDDFADSLRNGGEPGAGGSGGGGGKILSFFRKPRAEEKDDVAIAPVPPASPAPSSAPDPLILGAGALAAGAGLAAAMDMDAHSAPPASPTPPQDAAGAPPAAGIVGGSTAVPPPGTNGMNGTNGKRTGTNSTNGAEDKPIDLTNRGRSTGKLPVAGAPVPVPVPPPAMNTTARASTSGGAGSSSPTRGAGSSSGSSRGSTSGGSNVPPGGYWPPPPRPIPLTPMEQAQRRRRRLLLALLLLLLILLLACGGLASAQPSTLKTLGLSGLKNAVTNIFPSSDVTVSVVPSSQTVASNYVVTGVSGAASPSQSQISIQQLSYTTPAQTAKVTGTGVRSIAAREAGGTLEFFNGSLSPYTFGTNTPFTASNGVSFYLNASVTIPAANPPNFATATGTAHAAIGGTAGNIGAGAIFIKNQFTQITNPAAFSGGVDAQHYTFIQQSDVNSAVNGIQGAVSASAEKGLSAELQPGDALVNKVQCGNPAVSVDEPVGDHGQTGSAASGTASVTETCTGMAYKQADLSALTTMLLGQTAQKQLGTDYGQVGGVVTTVTTESASPVSLLVTAKAVFAFQVSQAQKTALANLIKGMSAQQAIATLEKQTGISSASIPGGVSTLPGNASQITIIVDTPTGLSGGGSPSPGASPTFTGPGGGTQAPTPQNGKGSVAALV